MPIHTTYYYGGTSLDVTTLWCNKGSKCAYQVLHNLYVMTWIMLNESTISHSVFRAYIHNVPT